MSFVPSGTHWQPRRDFGVTPGRFVELIEFRVRGFIAGIEAFVNDHVACGAGADAAASVVETFMEALRDIEDAAGQAVVAVGDFFWVDLDRVAVLNKGDLEFPGCGREFCFFDIRVLAAHFLLLLAIQNRRVKLRPEGRLYNVKSQIKSCRPDGRRYKISCLIQKSRQDAGGTKF